jgi:hypothetical protein
MHFRVTWTFAQAPAFKRLVSLSSSLRVRQVQGTAPWETWLFGMANILKAPHGPRWQVAFAKTGQHGILLSVNGTISNVRHASSPLILAPALSIINLQTTNVGLAHIMGHV